MRRTNIRGHALRGEGKAWDDNGEGGWMIAHNPPRNGYALCECGDTSGWLYSDAERKRWHARHKAAVRTATIPNRQGER